MKLAQTEQDRRLALFSDQEVDTYEERVINGQAYVKRFSPGRDTWEVAMFKDLRAFERYERYAQTKRDKHAVSHLPHPHQKSLPLKYQ